MSLWTATPVEASRELSVYHDISHVREALAARQFLRWSGGLMFAIVGGQLPGEFVADMVRDLVPRWLWHGKRARSTCLCHGIYARHKQCVPFSPDGIMWATA